MKLLRYGSPGLEKPGLLDPAGSIRDLSDIVPDIAGDVLLPASIAALARLDPSSLPLVSGTPRVGPCVGGVRNFIGIGLNYADHAMETGARIPSEPIVFTKAASCVSGPDDDLMLPKGSVKTDWEVELGVVIGAPARYVDEARALEHVAGFCVVHDVSERAFQLEGTGQWVKGKSADTFGPIGPWLVTIDQVPRWNDLALWLEVDGERRQDGSTSRMIFGVPYLVSFLSRFMSLHPGDIITTGTPPGVGMARNPPVFLRPGNLVRLGVDGLGTQTQRVVAFRG